MFGTATQWRTHGTGCGRMGRSRSPAVATGPLATSHLMAYDPVRSVSCVCGLHFSAIYVVDTWEWDGTTYPRTPRSPQSRATGVRRSTRPAAARRAVRRPGRFAAASTSSDTWSWDGGSWAVQGSAARARGTVESRDGVRRRAAARGALRRRRASLSDTWEWDGGSWAQIAALERLAARDAHAMAYDSARQRGRCCSGQTTGRHLSRHLEWDGSDLDPAESDRQPAGPHQPRDGLRRARAARRAVRRLATGCPLATPGSGTARNWTQRSHRRRSPAARGHAMAYDAARQRVVLFGGLDVSRRRLRDTWEWDGSELGPAPPAASPAARRVTRWPTTPRAQRVVLFGGRAPAALLADTWEWDGVQLDSNNRN